jgi:hypothetical protein
LFVGAASLFDVTILDMSFVGATSPFDVTVSDLILLVQPPHLV